MKTLKRDKILVISYENKNIVGDAKLYTQYFLIIVKNVVKDGTIKSKMKMMKSQRKIINHEILDYQANTVNPLPYMSNLGSSNSAVNKDMMSKIWTNGDTII